MPKSNLKLITINPDNINQYEWTSCFINQKEPCVKDHTQWLVQQFKKGLVIKLLVKQDESRPVAFIEYLPSKNALRAIEAKNYFVIQCIWVHGKKNKGQGLASKLIQDCLNHAKLDKKDGVAVIASKSSFMAKKDIFIKNGFKEIESVEPSFSLLVKTLSKSSKLPKIKKYQEQLTKYQGWHILYSKQCPWVLRYIKDYKKIAEQYELDLKVTELKTAQEVQNAPSLYAVFNLVHDGQLLADHYISATRFENILKSRHTNTSN